MHGETKLYFLWSSFHLEQASLKVNNLYNSSHHLNPSSKSMQLGLIQVHLVGSLQRDILLLE